MYEFADEERNRMRATMTLPQLQLEHAMRSLERVPELHDWLTTNQQIAQCVDLCVWRGRMLARYEAAHLEAVAEIRELEFDSEPDGEDVPNTNDEEL